MRSDSSWRRHSNPWSESERPDASKESANSEFEAVPSSIPGELASGARKQIYIPPFAPSVLSTRVELLVCRVTGKKPIGLPLLGRGQHFDLDINCRDTIVESDQSPRSVTSRSPDIWEPAPIGRIHEAIRNLHRMHFHIDLRASSFSILPPVIELARSLSRPEALGVRYSSTGYQYDLGAFPSPRALVSFLRPSMFCLRLNSASSSSR